MQRGLKDKVLYPAVYHQACKFLASGKAPEQNSIKDIHDPSSIFNINTGARIRQLNVND